MDNLCGPQAEAGQGIDRAAGLGVALSAGLLLPRLQPDRGISIKMSSRRAGLERGSVAQHGPQDVDPPTRQRDQGLGVSLALCPLSIIEGSGLRRSAQA